MNEGEEIERLKKVLVGNGFFSTKNPFEYIQMALHNLT